MLATVNARLKLKRLIEAWVEFRDTVQVVRDPGSISPAEEQNFLALQARIAALLPVLAAIGPMGAASEAQGQSRAMTELLNRYHSLGASLSDRDREEFARRWHESFVYLNKLRSLKVHGEKSASTRKPAKAPTGLPEFRLRRAFPGWALVKFVFQLGIIAAILYTVAWFVGVHRAPTGRLALGTPKNLSEVGTAAGQLLVSIWGGTASFLSPVVEQHGLESTIVLFAALFIAIGIWIFVKRA